MGGGRLAKDTSVGILSLAVNVVLIIPVSHKPPWNTPQQRRCVNFKIDFNVFQKYWFACLYFFVNKQAKASSSVKTGPHISPFKTLFQQNHPLSLYMWPTDLKKRDSDCNSLLMTPSEKPKLENPPWKSLINSKASHMALNLRSLVILNS